VNLPAVRQPRTGSGFGRFERNRFLTLGPFRATPLTSGQIFSLRHSRSMADKRNLDDCINLCITRQVFNCGPKSLQLEGLLGPIFLAPFLPLMKEQSDSPGDVTFR